jgi:polysaccharide biosynthesis protein PelE
MSDGRTVSNAPELAAVTLLASAAESAIAYFWLTEKLCAGLALVSHTCVVTLIFVWNHWSAEARQDRRLPLLAGLATAALGPFGPLGTLFVLLLARHYMRKAQPFEEWYRSLFPDTGETENRKIVDQIAGAKGREAETPTAFSDVLSFGSLEQKQDVIALISRHFRPAFGPVLKRALNDGHSAIRVQAATAMSKLENTILERTMELTRQVRDNPAATETLRSLAQHYDDCLFCGLLDARREEDLIEEALAVYRECLKRDPGDIATQLAAGRLLLRSRRFEEADECFAHAADRDSAKPQAALWHMESLFQLGKFDEIRPLARQWLNRFRAGEYPPEALEAVRLWAGAAPDDAPASVETS